MIANLKKEGTSFIFITHKMPEIFQLADRYTVFQNGKLIAAGNIKEETPESITGMMVGEKDVCEPRITGKTILEEKIYAGKENALESSLEQCPIRSLIRSL